MILHFIKRDFKSHKIYWIIIGLVTAFAFPGSFISEAFFMALFYAYVLFSLIPIINMTGVTWRSQHIMSRNYILALPVKREKLYLLIQYRAFVYWLPLFCLCLLAPVIVPSFKDTIKNYVAYAFMIVFCIIWFINIMISMQLAGEYISTHLPQKKRIKQWLFVMIVFFIELGIILFAVFCLLNVSFMPSFFDIGGTKLVPLIIVLSLAIIRFHSSRKSWLLQG